MPLIDEGQTAPAFDGVDQSGTRHTLAQYKGKPLVIYFYPKDDTPGCTTEACGFRDMLPEFGKVKATVLGVSPDDMASHAKFAEKFELPFPLLVDAPRKKGEAPPMCDAWGVWQEKTMYGRTNMGVVRTTYLIDGKGRVARRWSPVKVDGHVESVLEAVRELR